MKALILTEYKHLEMTEMPLPECGPEELRVRVQSCGICGSDVHGYDGSTGRRIPPIVMGHEAAGIVEAIGQKVTRFRPGDRITFDSTIYCGRCEYCRLGQVNLCDHRRVLGVSCGDYRQHGAFAEYVVVPELTSYRLPDELSFEHAAMVEAVSIAFHAVNRARPRLGEIALVVGTGMIGLLVIQALRLSGCKRIIAVDLSDHRLKLAIHGGATHAFRADSPGLTAEIQALTEKRGADLAFEVVGAPVPFQTSVLNLRKGGRVVLVGNLAAQVTFPLQAAVTRELALLGSCASTTEYPACIDALASGRITVASLISASAPLEEGPIWFDRLYRQEGDLMKVLLKP
ncbi:MAG TPA: galactitol-1-phosphate 5-dehydrogenase [Candidatus Paceibacterota bacterium]|nr:galactitol-1-phosphate 5-dehydrogenase [Verrucomicrobiota bacterium]HRY47878.1 galactitol-1-phosphate 5-dehydrogenase [Candidatus Paceibacterota bacterium]HRZ99990.1 galactitol-1-phosphate 5-dehydrogenase [Candidatus Paceibacterota bacterium]